MKGWKRGALLLLAFLLAFTLAACGLDADALQGGSNGGQNDVFPKEGESYYDLENVVLYLDFYGKLPPNYITKNEARKLGWEGNSLEPFKEGGAIGGDTFGNREGLLPKAQGRSYKECDLNTLGEKKRGEERLVYSSDGLYFHTTDHYESFTQV